MRNLREAVCFIELVTIGEGLIIKNITNTNENLESPELQLPRNSTLYHCHSLFEFTKQRKALILMVHKSQIILSAFFKT